MSKKHLLKTFKIKKTENESLLFRQLTHPTGLKKALITSRVRYSSTGFLVRLYRWGYSTVPHAVKITQEHN